MMGERMYADASGPQPPAVAADDAFDTLLEFLRDARKARPGARRVLVLSRGGPSCGLDRMERVERASSSPPTGRARGLFEVLVLDGCPVGAWEVLAEVATYTRCLVTAVEPMPTAGSSFAGVLEHLSTRSRVEPREIATSLVRSYSPTDPGDACVAIDVEHAHFFDALDAFTHASELLVSWLSEHPRHADLMCQAMRGNTHDTFVDLGAVRSRLGLASYVPIAIKVALDAAVSALDRAVLARATGAEHASGVGVSLFLPISAEHYRALRPRYAQLSFAQRTHWLEVLDALLPS